LKDEDYTPKHDFSNNDNGRDDGGSVFLKLPLNLYLFFLK
jgi:hypothetical protein